MSQGATTMRSPLICWENIPAPMSMTGTVRSKPSLGGRRIPSSTAGHTARRGILMANQCKFGFGKYGHIRIATGTIILARGWWKLPGCKAAGRIKRERVSAPLEQILGGPSPLWSGEGNTASLEPNADAASPVSWRRHALKAICANSGDLVSSMNMPTEG